MTTYYPLTRRGVYSDLEEMCESTGIDPAVAKECVVTGLRKHTELILCDRIALGEREEGRRAVLQILDNGQVVLWMGFMHESSQSIDVVKAFNLRGAQLYGVEFAIGSSDAGLARLH